MEENKVVNFEKKEETEGMSELKKSFMEHLQRARAQGIAIGSKTIALSLLSFIAEFTKNEDHTEQDYIDLINKIQSICEKTTNLELNDYIEQTETIREIMEAAEQNSANKKGKDDGVSTEESEDNKTGTDKEGDNKSVSGDKDVEHIEGTEGGDINGH